MSSSSSHSPYDEMCSAKTNDNPTENTDTPHPALLNHVIVQRIFDCLGLRTLKKCRLVCLTWKSIGDASFKKKYRICFYFKDKNCQSDSELNYPGNLNEFFRISQSEHPFTVIGFKNHLTWLPADLSKFFSSEGRFITDIKLSNVTLKAENSVGENVEVLTSYDLTALLSGIENLKKLTVARLHNGCSRNTCTTFKLAWPHLTRLKQIHLETCIIVLNKQSPLLSPVELYLKGIVFIRGYQFVKKIFINEIVNLDIVEKLSLDNIIPSQNSCSKLALDLGGNIVLKEGFFQGVELANFHDSCWKINSLRLSHNSFDENTSMVIKELYILKGICTLNYLPNSLKTLALDINSIVTETNGMELASWNISLPNVRQFELDNTINLENCIPNLIPCFCNLENLKISSCFNLDIDVGMIPLTVRVLTLEEKIRCVGNGHLALEELCFINSRFMTNFLLENLSYFAPKFLRVSESGLKANDPDVNALLDTSIPRVELKMFNAEGFRNLKSRYSFDRIDNDNDLGVIVNDRGSTITILYTSK